MMDKEIDFREKREPENLGIGSNMSTKNGRVKPLVKLKQRKIHSSAALYGSSVNDFMFAVQRNVYYVNFALHAKFIDRQNQPQTNEQSLPAWLAD